MATGSARPAAAAVWASTAADPAGRFIAAASAPDDRAEAIVALARDFMEQYDLRAVIVRVTIDGKEVVTDALGESMAGVPARRRCTSGTGPSRSRTSRRCCSSNTDPFRQWTPPELIAISTGKPHVFEPGTNWDYSHAGYVILGQALEKIAGKPMDTLMWERVLGPLGLSNTTGSATPAIPEPVLHTFTSERRATLGVDPGVSFYEESTYWNPSWTIAEGAIQTTNIYDMTATAEAIGTGALLTPESHQLQIGPDLLGFGTPLEGCPTCHTLDERYNYGLGIVRSGSWILQNPLFSGCGGLMAYLPAERIAVAVAVTFGERSFNEQGNYRNGFASLDIFAAIVGLLAPDAVPPITS